MAIIELCEGCIRLEGKKCIAYKSRHYMWSKHEICPGYATNKDLLNGIEKAIEEYQKRKTRKAAVA